MITLLSLITGAIGGNIGAGVFRSLNLGLAMNTIVGILGGFAGGLLYENYLPETPDLSALMGTILTSGGAAALFVWGVGLVRNFLMRR